MAPISEDIVYNIITNVAAFMQGADLIISAFQDVETSVEKTQKQTTFLNRALSTFTGVGMLDAIKSVGRGIGNVAKRVGDLVDRLADGLMEVDAISSRFDNLMLTLKEGILGPLWDNLIRVVADALDKINSIFRDAEGNWTEPFLRLRAVVQVTADYLLSIWQRLTGSLTDVGQTWLDRLTDGIVKVVQLAADLMRRFANLIAFIFGGEQVGPVTAEGIAAVTPAPMAMPEAVEPLKYEYEIEPEIVKEIEWPEPVAPPAIEDLERVGELTGEWVAATQALADASAAAAAARDALALAEERLAAASETVWQAQEEIEELLRETAEIPERFVRGRLRQLEEELDVAEDAQHARQLEADAAREVLSVAEAYERTIQDTTDALKDQIDTLVESISDQAEAYSDYLVDLAEAEAKMAAQAEDSTVMVDAFKGLDQLTAKYIGEMEGKLLPAFADMELSTASIANSLAIGWEKAKGLAGTVLEFGGKLLEKLQAVRDWWDGLPEPVQKLLGGAALVLGLSWATGVLGAFTNGLVMALTMAGLSLGPAGWALLATGSLLLTLIIANKEELAKWFDPTLGLEESLAGQSLIVAAQKAIEWSPLNLITGGEWGRWANENIIYPLTASLLDSEADMKDATEKGIAKPITGVLEDLSGRVVRHSIIPDLIASIIDWFAGLAEDIVGPLDEFTETALYAFETLATGWLDHLEDLTEGLDRLIGRFTLLADAVSGLPILDETYRLASGGDFKVVTVSMNNCTFGTGVNRLEVNDWIHEAFADVLS